MTGKVLVVEDDDSLRDVVCTVLEMEGYVVFGAGTGQAALDQVEKNTPEVILLDVSLPQMDGAAFFAELERLKLEARPKVIVLTADTRGRQIADDIGASGYMEKPFSIPALLQQIEQILAQA